MARILVISPTPSHPQDAGNRARIFALVSELQRVGHEIHFVYLDRPGHSGDFEAMERHWDGFWKIPYRLPPVPWLKRWHDFFSRAVGRKRVLPFGVDDWFDGAVAQSVREIAERLKPDIVMVEYVFISKIFQLFDRNVLKILDTHDVFGGRDRMFFQNNLHPQWFYTSEIEEKKGVDRADVILAIQPQEEAYFRKLSGKKVLTVGHLIRPAEAAGTEPALPPRLLFVGSSNHVNLEGIKWFIENVFGILRGRSPDIELDIVGNAANFIEPAPGLNLLGKVEDLTPFYKKASVVINPLRFGTGLKIKTVEALAMKRPLVTTRVGAAGIEEWSERAILCAEEPDKFADAILRIIDSRELRDTLEKGAGEFSSSYNYEAFSPLQNEIELFLNEKRQSPLGVTVS